MHTQLRALRFARRRGEEERADTLFRPQATTTRRLPSAKRSERSEQSNTVSRAAVVRRSERTRSSVRKGRRTRRCQARNAASGSSNIRSRRHASSSASDDEVGGLRARARAAWKRSRISMISSSRPRAATPQTSSTTKVKDSDMARSLMGHRFVAMDLLQPAFHDRAGRHVDLARPPPASCRALALPRNSPIARRATWRRGCHAQPASWPSADHDR